MQDRDSSSILISTLGRSTLSYFTRGSPEISERDLVDPMDRVRDILGVILHEMLHVLFDIYRSSCEHGCIREYRSDRAAQQVYDDALWQIAVRAIERCGLLGLCINLGRASGMTGDVYRGGALPSVDVLKDRDLIGKISWRGLSDGGTWLTISDGRNGMSTVIGTDRRTY